MSKKMKLGALLLALVAMSMMSVFAAGTSEVKDTAGTTIAYVGFSNTTPFWITLGNEAEKQAEAMGVSFINLTPTEPDAAMQKNAVDDAINKKVDGIIIGAVDTRAFGDSLSKAEAAGIPVVAVDSGIDHPYISSLCQTDNLGSARVAGSYIVENTTKGKVLILGGTLGHQTGNARRDGVLQVCEQNGYEVIFRACDWDDAIAYETAVNELNANQDIVSVFAAWDPGALSAVAAAKTVGRLDDLLIVGFDGNPANLKSINAGEQDATIKQDNIKMGQESVKNLVAIINGEPFETYIPVDGFVIDINNVADYI